MYLSLVLFNNPNSPEYSVSFVVFYIFLGVFTILGFLTFVFFSSFSKNRLLIDEKAIKLINLKSSSEIKFNEIYKIKIKRRTNGITREIYIWPKNNKPLFISAFENDFEKIERIIKVKLNKNSSITEIKELIDLDHILFYPILGLCVGFFSFIILDMVLNLGARAFNIFSLITAIYLFVLGIYFLIKRPICAIGAKKNARVDFVFGLLLIIFSIIILLK